MNNNMVEKLVDKTITKEKRLKEVKNDYSLLPDIINGVNSSKPAIRYGCGKVLMDLSGINPDVLYPHMDFLIKLLESKYRILIWQSMAIIANLTRVDSDKKFDQVFDKYFSLINNDYMVTVINLVGHSGKIALAKPNLISRITKELLKVENIKTTPHLTPECKKKITEQAILSFDMFFEKIDDKKSVISFIEKHKNSPRKTLKSKANDFLNKWSD